MREAQDTDRAPQARNPTPLAEYVADLAHRGIRILPGESGAFWARYKHGQAVRHPEFQVTPPSVQEVRQVLWHGRALVASYLMEPDADHPANAWLYLCADQEYALEKLGREMRYDVRRGLRELRITPLTAEQALAHGATAYCETRQRLGLRDGTLAAFRQRFTPYLRRPEYTFLGAWKGDQLAAFHTYVEVEDWVYARETFSMTALRQYHPNEAVAYTALTHYLVERHCRVVSCGVSPIQAESKAPGWHRFKVKVGFDARPVHRAFTLHPLLRPLGAAATLRLAQRGIDTILLFNPNDVRLRQANAVLSYLQEDATHHAETLQPYAETAEYEHGVSSGGV